MSEESEIKVEHDGYSLGNKSATLDQTIHLSRGLFDKLRKKAAARNMDVDEYVAQAILEKLRELEA